MTSNKYNFKNLRKDLWTAITGKEKDFVSGSIRRAIFMLSIPMILEMVLESVFAVVDIIFVSRVGDTELERANSIATVALTETMIMIIFAIAIGMSMAATAMVARRIGEGKPEEAAKASAQVMIITLGLSTIFSVVGIIYAPDILRLMGGEEDLIATGAGYTRILIGGNYSIMFLFLINAIFRGAGDASVAMRSLWLANGLNIILDPIFIFGLGPIPAFGVEGAAIATTIGRGTGVLYQLYSLYSNKSVIRIKSHHWQPDLKVIGRLFKISLGGIGQYMIGTLSWLFMVRVSAEFGATVLGGYALAFRVIMFTILPSWGMSNAAATLVGQNLGAGKPDRAEQSVWKTAWYNVYFLLGVAIIFFLFAEEIVGLISQDQSMVEVAAMALYYISFGYVFYAFGMVMSNAFNGAGDTRTPTLVNFICFWIIEIPLAYLLSMTFGMGPTGIFTAISISAAFFGLVFIWVFKKGKWKEMQV